MNNIFFVWICKLLLVSLSHMRVSLVMHVSIVSVVHLIEPNVVLFIFYFYVDSRVSDLSITQTLTLISRVKMSTMSLI